MPGIIGFVPVFRNGIFSPLGLDAEARPMRFSRPWERNPPGLAMPGAKPQARGYEPRQRDTVRKCGRALRHGAGGAARHQLRFEAGLVPFSHRPQRRRQIVASEADVSRDATLNDFENDAVLKSPTVDKSY